jgi:hypothetical protein
MELHPSHLVEYAASPEKMASMQEPLNLVLNTVIGRENADMDNAALVVGAHMVDSKLGFAVEFIFPRGDGAALQPVMAALHNVTMTIFDVVKDSAPDDEAAFDQAVERTSAMFGQQGVDPGLATLFTEAAMAIVHAPAFAEAMVTTLYNDGRLMIVKGSLLNRLLHEYRQNLSIYQS